MLYIDHPIFGARGGLEFNRPVGDSGIYNENRILSLLQAVGFVIGTRKLPGDADRKHLPSMGVPAQHQVKTGFCFIFKIMGLMIQQNIVAGRIHALHQPGRTEPARIRPVLPAGEADPVGDSHRLVFQHTHAVFLQLLHHFLSGKIAIVKVSLIVIPEYEIYAIGGFHFPQCTAAADHVLPGRIVIHVVSGQHHQIRLRLLDPFQMLCKAFPSECCTQMGIGDLYDAQRFHSQILLRKYRIIRFPDIVIQIKADSQIDRCDRQGKNALPIYAGDSRQYPLIFTRHTGFLLLQRASAQTFLLFPAGCPSYPASHPADRPSQRITDHPEDGQMQPDDDGVYRIDPSVDDQQAHGQRRQQNGGPFFSIRKSSYNGKLPKSGP